MPTAGKYYGIEGNPEEDIPAQLSESKLDPKYDLLNKQGMLQHLSKIKSNKVVIIGSDDFDWMPLVIAYGIEKRSKLQIYWYRPGFEALGIFKRVGQPLGNLESVLAKATNEVKTTIVIPGRNGSPAQKVEVTTSKPKPYLNPTGKVAPKGINLPQGIKEKNHVTH